MSSGWAPYLDATARAALVNGGVPTVSGRFAVRWRRSRCCRRVLAGPDERLDQALSLIESAAMRRAASGTRRDARQMTASLKYGVRRARSAVAWSGDLGSCTWPDFSHSTRRGG